jgi:carbon dioxide concentrating mechanism protein CcmM
VLSGLEACLAEHRGEYVRLLGIDPKLRKRVLEIIIQRPNGKLVPVSPKSNVSSSATYSSAPTSSNGQGAGLTADVVNQIRQLLAQGAKIGTEHADERHFRTSSWTSCSPIQSTREADVLAGIEACLAEHRGEYVRLIGIDPKAKRRVAEVMIQRPNGKQSQGSDSSSRSFAAATASTPVASPSSYSAGSDRVGADVLQQVSQLLAQGAQLGVEYADERRYRTSSWQSVPAIQARRAADAIASLESVIADHRRDYVRLVGIDPKAKRRIAEIIVHRPDGKQVAASPKSAPVSNGSSPAAGTVAASNGSLGTNLTDQVRQLLARSYRIGVEYADERRYKTSSWQSGVSIQTKREADILSTLQGFLREHPRDYVRLIGIDPQANRRAIETIIQKPAKK